MRSLGEIARREGHTNLPPPTTITWDGKVWPLDRAARVAWMEGYNPALIVRDSAGTRKVANSVANAHLNWMETCRFGDPFKDWRQEKERKFLKRQRQMEDGLKL